MSLVRNKKVSMNYELVESYEAGLELKGFEVKNISLKQGSLDGARVILRGGEAYVVGMYIPPYQQANTPASYDPYRIRRLLLKKKEIIKLAMELEGTNLTIVPVSLYNTGHIKLEIALAKRRNKADTRQYLKEKDDKKMIRQIE